MSSLRVFKLLCMITISIMFSLDGNITAGRNNIQTACGDGFKGKCISSLELIMKFFASTPPIVRGSSKSSHLSLSQAFGWKTALEI